MTRIAQLLLVLAALALWVGSRMTWVEVSSFDGLGQPKTATLSGASWSTALVPLALLVLAAAVAALAVRGWPLRLLAVLVAAASAGMGYLGIGLWVIRDVAVRAAELAQVPVVALVGTQRQHWGAVLTLVAAALDAGRCGAADAGGRDGEVGRREVRRTSGETCGGAAGRWAGRNGGRNVRTDDLGRPRRGS